MSEKPNPIPGNKPFTKGVSGNPGGRSKIEKHLRELIGEDNLDEMALVMAMIARGKIPPETGITALTARDVTKANEWIYDRCFGKAKQHVKITDSRAAEGKRLDPQNMSTDELRDALGAIATLKRLGGVADGTSDDNPTEH